MIYILFLTVVAGLTLIEWRTKNMAETLETLRAALANLNQAVTAQNAKDDALIAAVRALIAKLSPSDFTNEVAAVNAAIALLQSNDAEEQAAIDDAATKTA